ncbi:uncharacterized protein MKK02DRAFT_41665 [Dioszegia hungarica]|uniref:Uncharacterized protein n=1 Tax=Dioszegia hungarica TaxID=4972 RepID=A0AA38LQW1_9TREE|nr:uncharacterized protein MKK02DRAFT_41665 [Dioszegia hungarica]KAI9632023.1 hypothetical protein MKK02DRAFT_41665 [Dioszegia hungarica]
MPANNNAPTTLRAALNSLSVANARLYAGMGYEKKTKNQCIKHLVENPDRVPPTIWQPPAPVAQVVPQGQQVPPAGQAPPVLTQADIAAVLTAHLAPVVDRLDQLESSGPPAAGESPAPPTPAGYTAPAAESNGTTVADIRVFAPLATPAVLSAVLENRLPVSEFWKLVVEEEDGDVRDKEKEKSGKTPAKVRFTCLADILSAWLAYAQIRDQVEAGMAKFLLGHAHILMRLDRDNPGEFPAVLNYHLKTAQRRLHVGADFPLADWLKWDSEAFGRDFQSFANAYAAARAIVPTPSTPSGRQSASVYRSPASAGVFRLSSIGKVTSQKPCFLWNRMEACMGDASSLPRAFRFGAQEGSVVEVGGARDRTEVGGWSIGEGNRVGVK